MRNRDLILNKLETVESQLKVLEGIVKRAEPIESYISTIRKIEGIVDEIKSSVSREQLSPMEGNGMV